MCAALALGLLGACSSGGSLRARPRSSSPIERMRYVLEVGRGDSIETAARLVEFLDDPDVVVRWHAHRFLKEIAAKHGEDPAAGYDPNAPREDRLKAVERWREWIRRRRAPVESSRADAMGNER